MVNYYIYAKDFSGSTEGNEFYHTNGMETFKQFKSDVEKELLRSGKTEESEIIYLHWCSMCSKVDEYIIRKTYTERRSGGRSTEPETIIKWIQDNNIFGENDKIKLLYIITDGLITGNSAEKCFKLNENIHYETVVFHAFNRYESRIDLSVAASFFKSRCKVYRNNQLFDNIDISQEFNYDKITADNFAVEKENLKSYIKLKFIRVCKQDALALREIDKLKKLRNRLFEEVTLESQTKVNLETKNKKEFLREFARTNWFRALNAANQDVKVGIEKSISACINYIISDRKSYSFDALKFDTKFDTSATEETVVDVNFTDEQKIEFPDIILDDDKGIPVVILTEFNLLDKIIFHRTAQEASASFRKFRTAMDCPLFLMDDPDISESIGYFYTLTAYKQLLKTTRKEPRTRRTFHGGLVLTDTDLFDKYNDYVLSMTYFNSKKIKLNVGLFYFILWKNCESKEWIDENVKKKLKKYVMRRISATICKIGLSSLPLDPPEMVTLPTALWYCVELSSCIFKDDPRNFMHERMRMFYGVSNMMIEILKCLNYNLDVKLIEKRRELMKFVMILKKIPRQEKVYYLLEKIFRKTNGFLISEIEKPYNLNKLNYLKFNHKEMLREDVIEEKVDLNDYIHLMHYAGDPNESKTSNGTFRICKKTFRPFFTIDRDKSFYTELVNVARKVVINNSDDKERMNVTYEALDSLEFDRILSLYNLFIKCVKDSGKYPTLPEYIKYIVEKKKFKGDLVTIFPPSVYFGIENVFSCYQEIIDEVDVKEFIKVTNRYVKISERIKAEEVVKFNDDEIREFISKEILRVNLDKNAH